MLAAAAPVRMMLYRGHSAVYILESRGILLFMMALPPGQPADSPLPTASMHWCDNMVIYLTNGVLRSRHHCDNRVYRDGPWAPGTWVTLVRYFDPCPTGSLDFPPSAGAGVIKQPVHLGCHVTKTSHRNKNSVKKNRSKLYFTVVRRLFGSGQKWSQVG